MARYIIFLLLIGLASCGDSSNPNTDTETPAAIDTTKHPDGLINGSVISTDTAAMRVVDSTN